MSNRRFLTDEQIARIAELREKGIGYQCIANEIGCSVSTVQWQCLKEGVMPPGGCRSNLTDGKPLVIKRGNHVVRRFTADEDALIQALDIQGFTVATIAKRIGRKRHSVLLRLMTLARHDAIAEARLAARVAPNGRSA